MHGINLLLNIIANHECDAMKKHYKMTIKYFLKSQFGEIKCRILLLNAKLSITRSCQVEAHGIKLLVVKFCMTVKKKKEKEKLPSH